jgi:hypothetical protein
MLFLDVFCFAQPDLVADIVQHTSRSADMMIIIPVNACCCSSTAFVLSSFLH